MPVQLEKRLLNVNQAAEYLSMGRSKVYRWVRKGEIPSITLDSRRLFDVNDLGAFVEWLKETLRNKRA